MDLGQCQEKIACAKCCCILDEVVNSTSQLQYKKRICGTYEDKRLITDEFADRSDEINVAFLIQSQIQRNFP